MSERIKALTDAVTLLASDPVHQLEHLCKLGLPEAIDELALEFDALAAASDDLRRLKELDGNQYASIKKLDDFLLCMSGQNNFHLWTAEAISSAPEWKELRNVASECLRLLNQSTS